MTKNVVDAEDTMVGLLRDLNARLTRQERHSHTGLDTGGGGAGGTDEVWIGTDDPIVATPTIELWFDTDATAAVAVGPAGPTGPTGPAGAAGVPGAAGPAGPTGAQGPGGTAGPAGMTGPTGPQGIQGVPGPTGPSGPSGSLDYPATYGEQKALAGGGL
jgi:Collagen triple helix repeat (20 copies)